MKKTCNKLKINTFQNDFKGKKVDLKVFICMFGKRLKVVILMFYMHLVSAADVLILGSTIELQTISKFSPTAITPIKYLMLLFRMLIKIFSKQIYFSNS